MKLQYSSRKLEKKVASPVEIAKNYGTRAKLVSQRLSELKAASTLETMKSIPKANCHELKGTLKGKLAVDISANHRIIFEPYHDPIPTKDDGGLDWQQVTEINIIDIGEDYH